MFLEFKRFIIPFLIALSQILTAALGIGLLPALWILIRGGRWGTVLVWGITAAACLTAAIYALPLALQTWKEAAIAGNGWRVSGLFVGYGITALFAPMIIPEPLRIARRLLRRERRDRPEEKVRRKRRKRRSQQLPGELKIR
jgi:hypothetical protein